MSSLQSIRRRAHARQGGRSWYCGVLMWQISPAELGLRSARASARLRCTAEHLLGRVNRGGDSAGNIVAACAHCNGTRHRRKHPPSPARFRACVRLRLQRGLWHQRWVRASGLL